jgi:hypothetical protein
MAYDEKFRRRVILYKEYVEYIYIVEAEQELVIKENPLLTRAQARDTAIARAITYCKKHGILEDFLEKYPPRR